MYKPNMQAGTQHHRPSVLAMFVRFRDVHPTLMLWGISVVASHCSTCSMKTLSSVALAHALGPALLARE